MRINDKISVIAIILVGLNAIVLAIPVPSPGRGYHGHGGGGRRGNRPHGFRPGGHFNNQNKFGSNRRPVTFHYQQQRPYQTIKQKYPSSVILLPFQHQNVPNFQASQVLPIFNPWAKVVPTATTPGPGELSAFNKTSRDPTKSIVVDEAGPILPGPSVWNQDNSNSNMGVIQQSDPNQVNPQNNDPSKGSQGKGIVDEAGPVLPGPSVWHQEDPNSEVANQGDPSQEDPIQDSDPVSTSSLNEETGPVLPGPSVWTQEDSTSEATVPIEDENIPINGDPETEPGKNYDYLFEDEIKGESGYESKNPSSSGSDVDEYDISDLIDARVNLSG